MSDRVTDFSRFQNVHAQEKDYHSAVSILGAGVDFAYMAQANYTRLLFMLSKTMVG